MTFKEFFLWLKQEHLYQYLDQDTVQYCIPAVLQYSVISMWVVHVRVCLKCVK